MGRKIYDEFVPRQVHFRNTRIQELMTKDNALFEQIRENRGHQDNTLLSLRREREKVAGLATAFMEEERKGLEVASRRARFLCIMVLIIWGAAGLTGMISRFRKKD